jgi:Tax1-binding protein 1
MFIKFKEKQSIEKRLDDNDSYIASLQEKIKTLVTDKDSLIGRTKILEEEKEQLHVRIPGM